MRFTVKSVRKYATGDAFLAGMFLAPGLPRQTAGWKGSGGKHLNHTIFFSGQCAGRKTMTSTSTWRMTLPSRHDVTMPWRNNLLFRYVAWPNLNCNDFQFIFNEKQQKNIANSQPTISDCLACTVSYQSARNNGRQTVKLTHIDVTKVRNYQDQNEWLQFLFYDRGVYCVWNWTAPLKLKYHMQKESTSLSLPSA